MINYEKETIPVSIVEKVRPMMDLEVMSEAKIKNASSALVAVRIWIKAMITYHDVLKIVNPKRKIVAEKTTLLEKVMTELNAKIAEVNAIDEKLNKLNDEKTALESKA
jgi:dynein heavy chain